MFSFSLHSWKTCLLHTWFWADSSYRSAFFKRYATSFWPPWVLSKRSAFTQMVFSLQVGSVFSQLLWNIFCFQTFDYNVSLYGLLWVYPFWFTQLPKFTVYVFWQICEVLATVSSTGFAAPPSLPLPVSRVMTASSSVIPPQVSEALLSFLPQPIISVVQVG